MICPVYGEGNVIDQTCQKMFKEIYSGNFSIIDAPCSWKTDECVSGQIKTLLKNYQCYFTN